MSIQAPPETADGWTVLHQIFRFDRPAFNNLSQPEQAKVFGEFSQVFAELEKPKHEGQSAWFHLFGHKGDLMLIHFRRSFDLCAQAELDLERLTFAQYLEPTTSYLSVVEMGLYHATITAREELAEKGLKANSKEWAEELNKCIDEHRENLVERMYPEIPDRRFVSFYPMSKRRGEVKNWYSLSIEDRGVFMLEHGTIGRKYAGKVNQIISGSIGFDDWEWGVDLFVDDPLVCKQLVYEMRFDEGSSVYGEFGPFYFGRRVLVDNLESYLAGELI